MKAVFKRELHSYFTSVTGYLVMAALLLFVGIYYVFINLSYGYSSFSNTLSSVSFIFIIVIPILTMKSMAEDRKNKTDQLLLSSPVSVRSIIIGKYLSMISILFFVCLICCIFPILLRIQGSSKTVSSYSMLLAFFLFGCACIAIGLFISSLTENQILACAGTVAVLLILELIPTISTLVPTSAIASFLGFLIILIISGILIIYFTGSNKASIVVVLSGSLILTAVFIIKKSVYESLLPNFLSGLSLSSYLDNFYSDIFDFTAIVYYLTIIFVFLFFTIQIVEKRRFNSFFHGSMSIIITALVIAVAIFVNMFAHAIPTTITQIDISKEKLSTLSSDSEKLLDKLDSDVTIYALFENNKNDQMIDNLLTKYKEASKHVTVKYVDPVSNPTFTYKYDSSGLKTGTLIVESKSKHKIINYSDIYETTYDSNYNQVENFNGESEITSAIDYVVSDNMPIIYCTTGHNETTLPDTVKNSITKNNYELNDLSLLSSENVPEDCGLLMILAPQKDFSSSEKDQVISYLKKGGNAIIFTSFTTEKLDNFNKILSAYGLSSGKGIVVEGSAGNYYQNPLYIIPSYGSHDIVSELSSSNIPALCMNATEINVTEKDDITVTPLLTTSSEAYEKLPSNGNINSIEQEKGDTSGSFNLGVFVEKTSSDISTKLAVFSTPYFTEESLITSLSVSNVDLIVNSINFMCGNKSSINIASKSLATETITVNAKTVSIQALIFVIIIPLVLLVTGIVVWLKRRKK